MIMLVVVVSCSSTEESRTNAAVENKTVVTNAETQVNQTQPVETEKKTLENKPVKNTLNKIAKPFKKFGSDVEQAFDRLSTKDKDGDGE